MLVSALYSTVLQASPEVSHVQKPVIYLTFDDGPSADNVTEHLLEVLAEYDAKATFFVTGARARANPEKVANIVYAGHALGNHTLSHGRLTAMPNHQIAEEFRKTNAYVFDAGGPRLNCFRAPFGATDARVSGIARSMGMRTVGWSIDTRDWDEFADPEYLSVQLEDSHHNSVVLLHDGPSSRWKTLAVFSRWMEDAGHLYDFKALPDCVQPLDESFASLEAELQMDKPEVMAVDSDSKASTIADLLNKLRNYKFQLQPEVVAQNQTQSTTF